LVNRGERVKDGALPTEATTAIWTTNKGLESCGATVAFAELSEVLLDMGRFADRLLSTLGVKLDVPPNDAAGS
jgi:hypothetical protein